jgi:hypothetical protein
MSNSDVDKNDRYTIRPKYCIGDVVYFIDTSPVEYRPYIGRGVVRAICIKIADNFTTIDYQLLSGENIRENLVSTIITDLEIHLKDS